MRQLDLLFESDETPLRSYLEEATGKPVLLTITDNSTSILSARNRQGALIIRLHRIFLSADIDVMDEMARYLRGKKKQTPLIRKFIKHNSHHIRKSSPRKVRVRHQGRHYNLIDAFNSVNKEYFDNRVSAAITWGSKGPRRAAARRTLGSYSSDAHIIRINPLLDSRKVPRYFLDLIVYHEMLHADMGIETNGTRRTIHSKEFKRREKMFKHYDRAIAWENKRWG